MLDDRGLVDSPADLVMAVVRPRTAAVFVGDVASSSDFEMSSSDDYRSYASHEIEDKVDLSKVRFVEGKADGNWGHNLYPVELATFHPVAENVDIVVPAAAADFVGER